MPGGCRLALTNYCLQENMLTFQKERLWLSICPLSKIQLLAVCLSACKSKNRKESLHAGRRRHCARSSFMLVLPCLSHCFSLQKPTHTATHTLSKDLSEEDGKPVCSLIDLRPQVSSSPGKDALPVYAASRAPLSSRHSTGSSKAPYLSLSKLRHEVDRFPIIAGRYDNPFKEESFNPFSVS